MKKAFELVLSLGTYTVPLEKHAVERDLLWIHTHAHTHMLWMTVVSKLIRLFMTKGTLHV